MQNELFFLGRIIVTTLPAISTEGLGPEDVESLMSKTRSSMSEVFHLSSREAQQTIHYH